MKKIVLSLLVLALLASVSFAAKAPVIAKTGTGGMGAGVDVGGVPHLRIKLNNDQSLDVGLGFSSVGGAGGAAATTTIAALVRYEAKMLNLNDALSAHLGGGISFNSTGAAAITTTISLLTYCGAEYMISSNFSIYSNVGLLSLQFVNTAGAASTNYMLLNGAFLAYSGLRVYL